MSSTFTDNTGIEKIADGGQAGAWGQTTNDNFDIIDRALNGSVSIALSGTTHTLSAAPIDGNLSDGQAAVLVFTGSPSGTNTVTIAPSTAQKTYVVRNTTNQSVVLSQGSGANVTVPAGLAKIVYSDGGGATAAVFDITDLLFGNVVPVPALDIDCAAGAYFTKTISANSTFTFSNVPSTRAYALTLELTHTSGTVTWPTSVKFPSGIVPVLTTGKTHLFVFVTDDGGSRFRGAALVDYDN